MSDTELARGFEAYPIVTLSKRFVTLDLLWHSF
jgi:hypothetical protein